MAQFDAPKRARITSAIQAAATAYLALASELGEKDAKRTWAAFTKKGRGRPRGAKSTENDNKLLEIYDKKLWLIQDTKLAAQLPRLIATKLHEQFGRKYGESVPAITKKLNRLLSARKETERRALGAFLQRMSGYPPTPIDSAVECRRRIGRTKKESI